MASFSDTAFNDVAAFSVNAFDFALVPPIPPQPKPKRRFTEDGVGVAKRSRFRTEEEYAIHLRQTIKLQAEDDLEVVKILTEFLSRQ